MRIEEFINTEGYINTRIETGNVEETKLVIRTIYKNLDKFGLILVDGKVPKWMLLNGGITVATGYYMDIRLEQVIKMLNESKKEISSLRSYKIHNTVIREDIILLITDGEDNVTYKPETKLYTVFCLPGGNEKLKEISYSYEEVWADEV